MDQDDFEEGEILDSEQESEKEQEDKQEEKVEAKDEPQDSNEPEPDLLDTYNVVQRPSDAINSTYRRSNTLINQSDEDDSSKSSDEDTEMWKLKKSKYFSNRTDNDVKISDVIKSPIRPMKNGIEEDKSASSARSINFGEKRKKQNNIWGSVLTEQTLSQTMGSIGVERKEHVINSYRDVEAYDYLNAQLDDRPFDEGTSENPEPVDPFKKVIESVEGENKRGHKRGKRHNDGHHDRKDNKRHKRYRTCNPEDSDEVIVKTIVENLNEEKSHLIERILEVLGKKKSIELMYATEDIEEQGGMKTCDGRRRRTPGGVYIQLIKQDKDVTKEMIDDIFAEEQKKYYKELHKSKKKRQKEKRKLMKMLPQNRLLNQGNKQQENKAEGRDNSSEDREMDTENKGDSHVLDNPGNTSLKSNDEEFLNRSEDQLEIILGEEETLD